MTMDHEIMQHATSDAQDLLNNILHSVIEGQENATAERKLEIIEGIIKFYWEQHK